MSDFSNRWPGLHLGSFFSCLSFTHTHRLFALDCCKWIMAFHGKRGSCWFILLPIMYNTCSTPMPPYFINRSSAVSQTLSREERQSLCGYKNRKFLNIIQRVKLLSSVKAKGPVKCLMLKDVLQHTCH